MLHLCLKTKNFIPNEYHNSVYDIDFEKLYKEGYRLILSDLDNTLISYDQYEPSKENLELIKKVREIGFEIILVSNNIQSRLDKYTKDLDIIGLANARKPLNIGTRKAINLANTKDKDKIIFIGDQLMTDIWGAKRFGLYSVLVDPIKQKTEKWYTKLNRRTEYKMLDKINKKYPETYKDLKLSQRR